MVHQASGSALGFVQAHPRMFLRDGVPRACELAGKLVEEAALLGICPVVLDHIDGWWVVAAAQDWLAEDNEFSVEATFNRIVPFPRAGANSMRAEILLTAFANDVATYLDKEKLVVKGGDSRLEKLETTIHHKYSGHRTVAFRFREKST